MDLKTEAINIANQILLHEPAERNEVLRIIHNALTISTLKPSLENILSATMFTTGVNLNQLKGKSHKIDVCNAKRLYCYFGTKHYSLEDVGLQINHDHATVLFHKRKAMNYLALPHEKEFNEHAREIERLIYVK